MAETVRSPWHDGAVVAPGVNLADYTYTKSVKVHAFTPQRTRSCAPPGRHSPSFSAWKSASGRWETATTLPSNLRLANDLSAAAASLVDDLVRVRVTPRAGAR